MEFRNKVTAVALSFSLMACGGGGGGETAADTTVPDTTVPDTTVPDTTEPDTTEPVASLTDIIQLNLSGKTQVFTTAKSYTQTARAVPLNSKAIPNATSTKSASINEFTPVNTSNIDNVKRLQKNSYARSGGVIQNTAKSAETGTSNFFTLDGDGKMSFAASAEYSFEVSYSVIVDLADENGVRENYLIFAIDSGSMVSDEFITAADNCAIFKAKISDSSVNCLVPNVKAQSNSGDY